jgi:hypothetical protein
VSDREYPPATQETICETCGERGHYWCRPSRIIFTGRGVPTIYPGDFGDDEEWGPDSAAEALERGPR